MSDVFLIVVGVVGLLGWGYAFSVWRRRRRLRIDAIIVSTREAVDAMENARRDGAFDSVEEARLAVADDPGSCAVVRGGLDRGGPGTCIGCGIQVGDLDVHCNQPGCSATPIGGSR